MRRLLAIILICTPLCLHAEGTEADTAKYNAMSEYGGEQLQQPRPDDYQPRQFQQQHKDKNIPSRWGYSILANPGWVLALDQFAKDELERGHTFSLAGELRYTPQPSDGNPYAEDYGYPTFSLGFRYSFNHGTELTRVTREYNSILGDVATLYGKFSRPIARTRHFELAYYLGTGIGYSHKKYNTTDQVNNEFIGSVWNIYFTGGISAMWKLGREWALQAGVDFSHHSNGALHRPNKGTNALGPFAGIVYTPSHDGSDSDTKDTSGNSSDNGARSHKYDYRRGFYLELSGGAGAKTLLEDWFFTQMYLKPGAPKYRTTKYSVYGAFSFQADLMYRYARRWASGVGFDVFYGDYASKAAKIDEIRGKDERHSPWSFGIAAKHEVFYGRMSVRLGIGYYLYRHMGAWAIQYEEKSYYERVGLFYSLPWLANASIGFSVNAHATKADFTELQLSFPIHL